MVIFHGYVSLPEGNFMESHGASPISTTAATFWSQPLRAYGQHVERPNGTHHSHQSQDPGVRKVRVCWPWKKENIWKEFTYIVSYYIQMI